MGGAEVFTREVLKRWAEEGHAVTLFTSEFKDCKREEFVNGIRIVRHGGRFSVYGNAKKFYVREFAEEHYNVVIDEINTRPFMAPKFVKHGEKIVALIHQLAREFWFYETPFPVNYLGRYFLEERWLKSYKKVPTVTVSESSRKDLIDLGFERVFVVGEGLNFEPLKEVGEKEKRPVMVFAGRLKKAKRPDHAAEAFRIVKEKIPDAEFWVFGDGYLKNKLVHDASEGTKFFEAMSNEERRGLLSKAWVLVNPSVREGFGLNVIEANALGVPCVAYDVPGLRDSIRNGETGILVSSGRVEALAEAIINVLTNDDFRNKLSENALAYSRGFSWDSVTTEFMKIMSA
ncbi:MAG TPA: glycosyltransferase family 4 protein [Candidatus Bathyarchaeia archaeon]